jgi:hypothetical protein
VAQDFNLNGDLYACQLYSSSPVPVFTVSIVRGGGVPQRPWLIWPAAPGAAYTVQFKNTVLDASWQTLNGTVTILGNQAYFNDTTAGLYPRLYQVVAH